MEKRQSGSARRQQIVDAALAILNEQGVHRLTAAEIAARVGISDGTIFRHFPNKEAIVQAAIDSFEALLFAGFPPADPDPLARLRTFFIGRLALLREHPAIFQLAFTDRLAEAAGQEGADRMRAIVLRQFAFVRHCLVEAQERGDVGADLAPETLVWTVIGMLRGVSMVLQQGVIGPELISGESVWQNLETLLRRSAVPRGVPQR